MITCRTLGPIEFESADATEPVELRGNKNRALLFYLARSPRRTRSREHLVGLLWAEKPEEKARHSLREAIRILRVLLGEDGLESENDNVRVTEEALKLDIDEFEELEAAGDWAGASDLVAGEFLEDLSVKDAWAFEEWLTSERAFWRGRSVGVLARRCDELLASGRTADAVAISMRAHNLDFGSDAAIQAVMKSLALAGERSNALKRYDLYLERLKELNSEPDKDTVALWDRVKLERSWHLPKTVPVGSGKGAESRRAPLFGRTEELNGLVSALEQCMARGQANVGVIEGDSGTGKTRLAEELTARARLAGAAVTTFRSVKGDLESADTGILGLARGGLLAGTALATASARALGAFSAHIPEWADRFGTPKGATSPLDEALVEVTRAITGEQPVFMLVDDAQWSDANTLQALVSGLRDLKASPLFVCLSFAQLPSRDELDDLRSRIGRDTDGLSVHLDKLDELALHDLTEWALPDFEEDEIDRLTRRVANDSAGLPLLAVELLHAVALGLDLNQTKGAWPQPLRTLSQTLPGDLPDAIIGAIRVGFRRLSKPAQKVLAAAAALSNPTAAIRIGKSTGLDGDKLDSALDELEWQRWLAADARGYSFVARIVRDVIRRDMLTEGQKRRILDAAEG